MRLYVANASLQKHQFQYRIPEVAQMRTREIQPLSQEVLPDDLNQMQIDYIVEQMSPYGFPSVEDVKSKRMPKSHTRLVYSVDRPVSDIIIGALYGSNDDALKKLGIAMREDAAVAANNEIVKEVENKQREDVRTQLREVDFTIQEEEPARGYDRPEKDILSVGMKIAKTAEQESRGRGRPRKAGR